ncbi:PAS domain-containing sensor histidine kinase [Phenylobacterium sp.]|uniref:PAS domain-containing sensor histidine kinase n=1 Tax=Phenylobacterium sp. TaxID=1871053 RepID=UPI002F411C9B
MALALGLRNPKRIAIFIALGVAATALAAMIGWQIGSVFLISVVAGAVALWPATAVALMAGAGGLASAATGRRRLQVLTGGLLLAACATWLWADATHQPLPIDLALFRDRVLVEKPAPLWPGRPSIITSVVIALFAASLLGIGARSSRSRAIAVHAASLGALVASLSALPYLLQDPSQLSVLHQDLRIAVNTTVAVGALCVGALILMRDTGWLRVVTGRGEQGRIARLLAPVALIPVAIGSVTNIGVREGFYGSDVRMLLIIVLSACALLFLAFWAARMLGRERQDRDSLADALERSTVIVCTPDGLVQHWSKACETLYGWTAAEMVGRQVGDLISAETEEARATIRALLQRDGEWRGEQQHRTRSGEIRWVASHLVRLDGGLDGGARIVATFTDVTETRRASNSLKESQERLKLAVEAYDIGIADADIAARTLVAEDGFERLLGYEPGGLEGSLDKLNSLVVAAQPGRNDVIAAHLPQQNNDEIRMRRADGEERDFLGVRRLFYSPEGAHVRTIGIYRDVTEERRVERELALRDGRLAELRTELAHVSRLSAMGEMAAALAHELNQPLTAIGNSVGALKMMLADGGKALDDTARGRVARAADQAEGQAVRAGEIVRRLREFIARGEADTRIEPLDQLIEDAVALAAPNAKAADLDVRLNLSSKAQRVLADRIQIQQILVNLIRNAAEAVASTAGPRVLTVSTTVRKGMAEVAVRDSGPGVPPDLAERLFSPFVSTKSDGMGVGLSICHRIVEAHGGRMWLAPSACGADFRFTLPLASKELAHAR